MAEQSEITEDQKFRFEARLREIARISAARSAEQKRVGDKIEMLIYEAKSEETCNALVALAAVVFEGPGR